MRFNKEELQSQYNALIAQARIYGLDSLMGQQFLIDAEALKIELEILYRSEELIAK